MYKCSALSPQSLSCNYLHVFMSVLILCFRKRGRKPDDEDPEIKRQKFLERNRAAASRCRAKKKQWVDNLEKKAKDMEGMNSSLQQEVLMLRSEVQQLKSILIAHKDCPLIVHHTKGKTS